MEALKELETKVRAVGDQLESLRKQNRGLKTKLKKLEAELAEFADGDGWKKERTEIRDRVARLTEDLEALL